MPPIQTHAPDTHTHMPPYPRLIVAEGNEDITIKVSDEGGGIARSGLPNIFTYLYSTAHSPVNLGEIEEDSPGPSVLAGYGYGLPMSRLYARYFGGDLQINSMEVRGGAVGRGGGEGRGRGRRLGGGAGWGGEGQGQGGEGRGRCRGQGVLWWRPPDRLGGGAWVQA